MLTAALLHDFLQDGPKTYDEILRYLDEARQYPTGRLWIDCLIRPTLLAHRLVRAEREGDFLLPLQCLRDILPYFFAAVHHNYARYITTYLQDVDALPEEAQKNLCDEYLICRHKNGAPGVSADQFGEQTYIKQGKGPDGLKGISTNPEQVAVWTNSFSIFSHVALVMEDMWSGDDTEDVACCELQHKKEGDARKKLDNNDHKKLLTELTKNSHPLITNVDTLYHIVNG